MDGLFRNILVIYIFLLIPVKIFPQAISMGTTLDTVTIIQGLDTPWEILWGPDDHIWMTERPGRISRVNPETGEKFLLIQIPGVHEQSESGLLGMAIHPDFSTFSYVYVAYNYLAGNKIQLKIERYTYSEGILNSPLTLLDSINGNSNHNGCRLLIGKDEKLYITTGDAQNTSLSQNTESLSGKILRMNLDGLIPEDNPFPGSYIWSFGHRNPQGLIQVPAGIIYSSEHGPSNDDELNLIEKGRNYGWPDVEGFCNLVTEHGFCTDNNIREPLAAWTPTLAVAGIDYYCGTEIPEWENSILMVSLKASRLVAMKLSQNGTSILSQQEYFNNWWGRLRDICITNDGRVFISTSNKDGRGVVKPGDDRIVEIRPTKITGNKIRGTKNLLVYPNPVTGNFLKLEHLQKGETLITIFDISGKIIFEQDFNEIQNKIEIPFNWNKGIYVLKALNGNRIINLLIVKP
jgi:glucose/arabinose dehydrogenase